MAFQFTRNILLYFCGAEHLKGVQVFPQNKVLLV